MDVLAVKSTDGLGFGSHVRFGFMCASIALPVIWKLYTTHAMSRYYLRQTFYISMVLLSAFLMIILSLRSPFNAENGRKVGTYVFIKLLRVADMFGIRVVQRGLNNFNIEGPFIIVSNHQTSLDMIPMFATWPDRCSGMGKRELLFAGPFGVAALLCGGMLIDRRPGKSREAMQAAAQNIRKNNARLWIFVEGTRNHKEGLLPFKKGAFHLALQAGVPIVPVVISTYSHFYDKRKAKFEGGDLIVTVLPAVSSKNYTPETMDKFIDDVRSDMLTTYELTSQEVKSKALDSN